MRPDWLRDLVWIIKTGVRSGWTAHDPLAAWKRQRGAPRPDDFAGISTLVRQGMGLPRAAGTPAVAVGSVFS
jgi:hypothetical protein